MSGGGAVPAKLGKYEIRGTLGRGAMGVVLDGWDPIIDRRVAIKTLRLPDPSDTEAMDALDRFKREAQAAGRLTHPNIVGVFEYGETDELAFIVMEFVEGRSLKDVLGQGPMSTATAVRLIEEVLAGLAYSHGRGVVHRDIKPANIMLTKEDQAKIADFGIARIESSSMTQAGTIMGTPAYMPPEQFLGQTVDRRADIYSCGVMLYQLLTGERPFEGSLASIMHKVMNSVPPRPSDVAVTAPAVLDAVVAKAMARRPEDRFESAAEFAKALRDPPTTPLPATSLPAPAAEDSEATVVSPRGRTPRIAAPPAQAAPSLPPASTPLPSQPPSILAVPARSHLPMLAGLSVAVLAAAGAAGWFLLPSSRPSTTVTSTPSVSLPQPDTITRSDTPSTTAGTPTAPVPPGSTGPQASTIQPSGAPSAPTTVPSNADVPAGGQPAPTSPGPVTSVPARVPTPSVASPPASPAETFPATPPAPAASPPTVTAGLAPAPSAPAAPSTAAVAAALALRLPGIGCSLLQAGVAGDGSPTLTGPAGKGAPTLAAERAVEQVAGTMGAVTWGVHSFDGPFCPVLDYLRTLPDTGLRLEQDGGAAPLADGEPIAMRVTMPGFAGFLHVAYLQSNQVVSTLVPGPGYPAQTFNARATTILGTKRDDSPGWLVGAPFGTDMIVAIVSTAPLFSRPPPDDQPLTAYVSSLRTAIDGLRRRGGTVAVAAQPVDTVAAKPGR